YRDFSSLIENGNVEVIMEAAPAQVHREADWRGLERGSYVFGEKPATLTKSAVSNVVSWDELAGRLKWCGHKDVGRLAHTSHVQFIANQYGVSSIIIPVVAQCGIVDSIGFFEPLLSHRFSFIYSDLRFIFFIIFGH